MKFRLVCTALITAALLLLGACGDDGPSSSALTTGGDATTSTANEDGATVGAAEGATRLWIRPDLIDCQGVAPQKCMQIAESENGEFLFFYDSIEGFTFAEGTSYVIDVTIEEIADPPADGSSVKYTLVQIVEEVEAGS